jgi:cytochrome c553
MTVIINISVKCLDEKAKSEHFILVMNSKMIFSKILYVTLFATAPQAFAQATASAGMGKGLYAAEGANSCLFCHGIAGEGGNIKDAAELSHPKKWKTYAALGGDEAFKKDPAAFVQKMKEASINLIQMGAIRHNATYKAEGYNKAAIKPFNAQMMGLSGAASVAWMNRYKDRGVTPAIAAESTWLHIMSFDKDGVFKK